MPKIAEIEDTPNPNAVKFILMEPLTWGITRSYDSAEQAQDVFGGFPGDRRLDAFHDDQKLAAFEARQRVPRVDRRAQTFRRLAQ